MEYYWEGLQHIIMCSLSTRMKQYSRLEIFHLIYYTLEAFISLLKNKFILRNKIDVQSAETSDRLSGNAGSNNKLKGSGFLHVRVN